MELLFIIPFCFLLLGGGALVALVVMARTSLRQPAPAKTVGRWLLVLALCAAQVSCWQAADRFGQNVGGNAGTTDLLQWVVIGVATLWLVHQAWRLVGTRRRRTRRMR